MVPALSPHGGPGFPAPSPPCLSLLGGWALVLAEPEPQAALWRPHSLSSGPLPRPCLLTSTVFFWTMPVFQTFCTSLVEMYPCQGSFPWSHAGWGPRRLTVSPPPDATPAASCSSWGSDSGPGPQRLRRPLHHHTKALLPRPPLSRGPGLRDLFPSLPMTGRNTEVQRAQCRLHKWGE